MRRLLGAVSSSFLLHKLRSFRSPIQDHNPINEQLEEIVINHEHLLPNNNIDQEQNPINQEENAQQGDQAQHPHAVHELRNDAVPVSLFLLTASIFLVVNHPAGDNISDVLYPWIMVLYTTSLYITFFLSIGLLLYTITSGGVASEEVIRVQSRLMILGLVSLIAPVLITTSFTVHIPVLGLVTIWIPLLITFGLSLRFLSEANRLLR